MPGLRDYREELDRLGHFLDAYHAANGTQKADGASFVSEAIRLIEENAEAKTILDRLGVMTNTLFGPSKTAAMAVSIEPEVT